MLAASSSFLTAWRVWLALISSWAESSSSCDLSSSACRSSPPTHLPLIFSAPLSARAFHLAISSLAAGRSGLGGLLSTNCCQIVTEARAVSTELARELVPAKLSPAPPASLAAGAAGGGG